MSAGTPEAEELALYLRELTYGLTTRALEERFGQGRTQWSEFRKGSKLIPQWLLQNVAKALVTGPLWEAKFQQGRELLEAAEAAATRARAAKRPTGSQAELQLRLDDARKAQIKAQQMLMNANQLVIMLLGLVASLQSRCARLQRERDQALADYSGSASSEIVVAEQRIVAAEERLQRARREREEAEDLRVIAHQRAEEHRIALHGKQSAQVPNADTVGGDTAEAAHPLWEYDQVLEAADAQLDEQRHEMDRLWKKVGTSDPQEQEGQQVITGEVVRQDSADNGSSHMVPVQRPGQDGRSDHRLWKEAGTNTRQTGERPQASNGTVVRDSSADTVRRWVGTVRGDGRTPWERLTAMPGLDVLKQHFEQLRAEVEAAQGLRAAGRVSDGGPPALHLVFTGNPGTGKTTVARLVGEMYRDMGLLSRGHVVEARMNDLVAGYVGQTAALSHQTIDRALDGVLLIDEAYGLSDQRQGFGDEAIQTLLKRMEDDRGRLVVIVAGYPEKMKEFVEANSGLASRFPNILEFPDYAPDTLQMILEQRLDERGLQLAEGTADTLREIVTEMHRTRSRDFGNGREMRTLADALFKQWARRVRSDITEPVTAEDVPEVYRGYLPRPAPDPTVLLAELDAYVGLGPVRDVLADLAHRLRMRQALHKGTLAPPHLLFSGPPGTGKTTVARLIGKLFRDLGLLRKGHVVEVTRANLVGGFIGQTAPLVREAVIKALDGVLFIDEAYSLVRDTQGQGGFGAEAIDTLVREMEHWRGRVVVIAAGYSQDMAELLSFNPGMRSRFTVHVSFPEYSFDDLVEILRRMADAEGYTLGVGVPERAAFWLRATRQADPAGFGNARTVRGLLEVMEGRKAVRFAREEAADAEFLPDDVPHPPGSPPYAGP
ncbi:AAA family ATPase [Streptomyces decoyicus]